MDLKSQTITPAKSILAAQPEACAGESCAELRRAMARLRQTVLSARASLHDARRTLHHAHQVEAHYRRMFVVDAAIVGASGDLLRELLLDGLPAVTRALHGLLDGCLRLAGLLGFVSDLCFCPPATFARSCARPRVDCFFAVAMCAPVMCMGASRMRSLAQARVTEEFDKAGQRGSVAARGGKVVRHAERSCPTPRPFQLGKMAA